MSGEHAKHKLAFDGVDDHVKMYCPRCDEYTMEHIGESLYKCPRCGLEMKLLSPNIAVYLAVLQEKEIKRLYKRRRRD